MVLFSGPVRSKDQNTDWNRLPEHPLQKTGKRPREKNEAMWEIEVLGVCLQFRRPFRTSSMTIRERNSVLVRIGTVGSEHKRPHRRTSQAAQEAKGQEESRSGWGECAPWPSVTAHTLEVLKALTHRLQSLPQVCDDLEDDASNSGRISAARTLRESMSAEIPDLYVRAAFDTALLDFQARAEGISLCRLLGGPLEGEVPVNAVLGADETVAEAIAAVANGFETLKLKVGAETPERDASRVGAVRAAVGDAVRLRVDANGAWTVDEAVLFLRSVEKHRLEMIEQPVPAQDVAGLAQVRASSSVPVVADEALSDLESLHTLLRAGAMDGIMIKTHRVGGPTAALALIEAAREAGLLVFVSSLFETAVGVAAAAHLAAAAGTSGAAGLATGQAFVRNVAAFPVQDGKLRLGGPGLGFTPTPVSGQTFSKVF